MSTGKWDRTFAPLAISVAAHASCNALAALIATRALGAEQRGVMVLGITIGAICATVAGLGVDGSFRHLYPGRTAEGTRRRRDLVQAFTACSAAGILAAGALALLCVWTASAVFGVRHAGPGFACATAAWAAAQAGIWRIAETWYAAGGFAPGGRAIARMAFGGLCAVVLASAVSAEASTVLLAQALGIVVLSPVDLVRLWRLDMLRLGPVDRRSVRELVGIGVPQLGMTLGMTVALRADRFILAGVAGPATLGVYALASTLSEFSRVVTTSMAQVMFRDIAEGAHAGSVRTTLRHALICSAVMALLGGCVGFLLIRPVFGPEFGAAPTILAVLLLAELCFTPHVLCSKGLIAGGWTKVVGAIGIGGGALAVATYYVGARAGGATGIALASVPLYGALSILTTRALCRRMADAAGSAPHQPVDRPAQDGPVAGAVGSGVPS